MANYVPSHFPHDKLLAALRHAQLKATPSLVRMTDGKLSSERDLAQRFEQCMDAVEALVHYCWHQRQSHQDWFQPQFFIKAFAAYCRTGNEDFSEAESNWIRAHALLALAVLEAEVRFFPGVHDEPDRA